MIISLKNFLRIRFALLLLFQSLSALFIFFKIPFVSDGTAKVEIFPETPK